MSPSFSPKQPQVTSAYTPGHSRVGLSIPLSGAHYTFLALLSWGESNAPYSVTL